MRRFAALLIALAAMTAPLTSCAQFNDLLGSAIAGAKKPSLSMTGARITDLRADGLQLEFDVDVLNPYDMPMPLTNIKYALGVGADTSTPLFNGAIESQGSIPAKGKKGFKVPVDIGFSQLLAAASAIKPGQVVPYKTDLGFAVKVPGTEESLELPVSHEGQFPVPAPPEISLAEIEWGEMSLTSAKGALKMKVRNSNEFVASLSKLNYGLKLNGTKVFSGEVADQLDFAAGGEQTISIPIAIKPLDFGLAAVNMLKSGNADYSLDGNVNVGTPFGDLKQSFAKVGKTGMTQ